MHGVINEETAKHIFSSVYESSPQDGFKAGMDLIESIHESVNVAMKSIKRSPQRENSERPKCLVQLNLKHFMKIKSDTLDA